MKRIKETDVGEGPNSPRITAILSYSKGFACALGSGTVYLFEKKEEDSYRRSKEIRVNNNNNNINFIYIAPLKTEFTKWSECESTNNTPKFLAAVLADKQPSPLSMRLILSY